MAYGSDLGWWGRHPYLYVTITTGAAVVCLLFLGAAIAGSAVGVAVTAALFGALMTVASIYSWHWLLRGRHRDKRANDLARWTFDSRFLKVMWVLAGLFVAALVLIASVGLYAAWRLDRYGIGTSATVLETGGTSCSAR